MSQPALPCHLGKVNMVDLGNMPTNLIGAAKLSGNAHMIQRTQESTTKRDHQVHQALVLAQVQLMELFLVASELLKQV